MNRKVFFDGIRKPLFGSLSQSQVNGCENILNSWEDSKLTDLHWLAYMFATTFHETAQTMEPIEEYGDNAYFFRMYDKDGDRPEVAEDLGNTQAGDGIKFHGRGYVQITGRANYTDMSRRLEIDLVNNPELALNPDHASFIMFEGMTKGTFTGRRLDQYFNETKTDWKNARRIVNRLDKADKIAGYAKKFHSALVAASEAAPEPRPSPPPPAPEPTPTPDPDRRLGFWASLIVAVGNIFQSRRKD